MNGENLNTIRNCLKLLVSQISLICESIHFNDQPCDSPVHLQYQTPHHKHNKCM